LKEGGKATGPTRPVERCARAKSTETVRKKGID